MKKMKEPSREKIRRSSLAILQDLAEAANPSVTVTAVQRESQLESLRIQNQTKIFASMCPDEILDHYNNFDTRAYYTALMLGDVSGFTEMTEKYTKFGKGGPSKITETLNSYIGAMVQEILSCHGDVLKFSGDAFMVMWKLEDGQVMRDIASKAIKTACIIQKHFGTYETEVDIVLKVKLAISSGKTYFTSIGDSALSSYYIITGKPVWEAKFAATLCRGGDILVAASCWQWINPNDYIYEILPDGIHILIISSSVLWDDAQDSYNDSNTNSSNSNDSDINSNIITDSSSSDDLPRTTFFYRPSTFNTNTNENMKYYSLRPKVIKAAETKLKKELRSYMLRPVIRSVEMDEPLEYLTEIRQIVIVFVNLVSEVKNRKTLIKLVNTTFVFVCSVVKDMQGCVNKTSLFDKDLIFLCIFGLRGDKHDIEAQIGLRCALKLRQGLSKIQNVKSVSIGVTTGMTYCGVVGHVLRREYTVIGMAVNKAARLMCAYVNKVVCDREIFLQSHLEAKHFILQEPKHLKGITNVGPIYEFVEQIIFSDHELNVNKYPLLGRIKELHIFINILKKILDGSQIEEEKREKIDIMIIRGEPRMGKTRLLEEMTVFVPKEVSVNFISLAPYDNQIPYILTRLIFYVILEISEDSPLKEKERKLAAHFKKPDTLYLWLLNLVFNVNFNMMSEHAKYGDKIRKRITKKLLHRLIRSCFKNLWVIFIDDSEFADEESLLLFHTIAKYGNVFFVLGFGNKLLNNYLMPQQITRNAQTIDLEGLDKWFHAALACQVLDVVAIPAELEKVIQERSSGNPGWIESFLISLLQSSAITITKLTSRQIHEIGLVNPSINMLRRVSDTLVLEFNLNFRESNDIRRWEMYQTCFKENIGENDNANKKMSEYDNKVEQNVCTFTSNTIPEDIDTETTMDSILLNLFDSLTPLDQLLLKCAAILGEIINRIMLEQLMQGVSKRDIGLCIVKLFELRIIGCSVGDFSRSPGPAVLFQKIHNNNANIRIRCGCKGIEISEVLSDLPIYASCGSMRFKLNTFRETTYRLLTENQKVEFHSQALRYLRQNTRRCNSCGGGYFNKLLGKSSGNETEKKKLPASMVNILSHFEMNESENNYTPNKNLEDVEQIDKNSEKSKRWYKICKPICGSPTHTFSNIDFTNCECNLNLLTAYTHILQHCRGIGDNELLLVAILEFVEVCLSTLNIPQAMKLLAEGDLLVDTINNSSIDELIVLPYLRGKIRTLRGRCFLESGLIMEAMKCFEETMRIMKYKFPTNPLSIKLKSLYVLIEQKMMLTCLRNLKVGIIEGNAANYNDQFASCLAHIFIVYRVKEAQLMPYFLLNTSRCSLKGMQDHARLAAIWGLNLALESSKDFFVLCTSYGNMMIVAHNYQYNSIIPYLERDAINLCNQRKNQIEFQELNAVAELYTRIFFSRWLRGMIDSANNIGFISVRLARTIRSMNLKLIILPRLIQLLITECRYSDVVPMLQELEFISQNDMDQSGRTWYYSLCVDLLLESGVSLVTLRECEQFYQQQSSKIINLRDTEATKRLYTCMWLWYVRVGNWGDATVWRNRNQYDDPVLDEYTVPTAITLSKKLEGLIICYVYKIDNKNLMESTNILQIIKNNFKIMDRLQKVVKSIQPRYLLMKAYYQMARSRVKSGMALLQNSKRLAQQVGNQTIYNWADHCEKSWMGSLSLIQQDFWKEQCTMDKLLDWHEVHMKNWKFLPYTLPLPKIQNFV